MAKVTVSLPDEYVEAAKRLAGVQRTTVSGLTARALRDLVLREDLKRLSAAGATIDDEWLDTIERDRAR